MSVQLAPETIEVWTNGLTRMLSGLDLFDAEDRSTFRGRVLGATEHTTVTRVRELAAHFGRPVAGNSTRSEAHRALAEAWIARAQQDALGRLWRLAERAEERSAMIAPNLDHPARVELLDRAEDLREQARQLEARLRPSAD